MIDGTPNPKTAKLLRNICIAGWFLCLAAAARFVGAPADKNIGIEVLLFAGIFVFSPGAILIAQKRTRGALAKNCAPVPFHGVPRTFTLFHRMFCYAVLLLCFYLMMRDFHRKPEWPNFGISVDISFVLIPAVFYLTSAGAYWSATIEGEKKG